MTEANTPKETFSKQDLLRMVVEILKDLTSDWDLDFGSDITPETLLVADLEFESIDVVQFVVQIEELFQRKDLPLEKLLMVDGRYRDDMRVEEVADFLHENL